ncbi:MAG: acyl-CoA dehydrogenase [Xanthomonadales bacterium]|nr:acyl-CoA dehydrogenase [Gammaproteobacteria bacterium]MBT8054533.1 acyl-CoA dehydrogenase [Gammaproteobacteria bacterium]NND56268.1 acyl-CoA dehydrogenase [Xanthomonadales bacterium]NNK52344.1 acyl-CoA dehydrogenase [Xanthomonadales bacterium]NNL94289.1 acyl-CoA dehydrogenase [Xanthomonadales bacterium]
MTSYIDLPLSGLEGPLSEMEELIQDTCHRFAVEVMRPAGPALDEMTPEETVAPGSPLWQVLEQAQELGLSVAAMLDMDEQERSRLLLIAAEELAWGEPGLAGMILVSQMPALYAALAGNMEMVEYCDGKMGCWGITEPDHGSDTLDADGSLQAAVGEYGRPNCVARIEGDKIIINGQKSAWVSGGITAQVCALYCHLEEDGATRPGLVAIVPLDLPGVSRGKPLDKMGLRALNQGEIYFDNVEVPISHLLAGPDEYVDMVYKTLAEANVHVANLAVGVARAAYEHALEYAHQRKQGGQKIIHHQNVKYRLFHMFRKVEAARALVRRVSEYNATASRPALQGSIASKVTATQTAFEVASEALQMFGGNGLTKEYPVEKLLRDARACLIADGCNEILAMKGGNLLVNPDLI